MKISKFFWGGGIAAMPSPDPCPGGEGGHPLGASLLGASILAPLALGVPTLVFFYKLTTDPCPPSALHE